MRGPVKSLRFVVKGREMLFAEAVKASVLGPVVEGRPSRPSGLLSPPALLTRAW